MDEALTASNLSTVGQPVFALFECEEIFFVMSVFESCSFPAKIVMIGDNFSTFFIWLTAKNRDQLRNPTLCNRVWLPFLHVGYCRACYLLETVVCSRWCRLTSCPSMHTRRSTASRRWIASRVDCASLPLKLTRTCCFVHRLWAPLSLLSCCCSTGALLVNKSEATGVVIIARWPPENSLNVWWAQVLHTKI